MNMMRRSLAILISTMFLVVLGCASPKLDFAALERPPRAAELGAFDVFVGEWDWQADVVDIESIAHCATS